MDEDRRIEEPGQPSQKEQETAEARMQEASEFWEKYDDDTLPPMLQAFKVRAVTWVRGLPDALLENEEVQYALPPQLEDREGEAGLTASLKERLWMRVFTEERARRGIADPNVYDAPFADAIAGLGADTADEAAAGEMEEAPEAPIDRAGEDDLREGGEEE